jgi:penicillin-binding protein 1A
MSSRRERIRRRRSRGGPAKIVFLSIGVLVAGAAIGVLGAVGYVVQVANSAPPLERLKPVDQGSNSVVYAADGTRLGVIQSDVLRRPVPSWKIPENIQNATIAVEDRRFYAHEGVDFEGVVRAAVKNIESGKTVEGGSTLTMQLVRTLYISDERTFQRKIREAKLAEELENVHTGRKGKKWILTKYLNSVPYGTEGGQTAVGIQAAARVYFDKPASELKLHEAALLAGLPQAPSSYSPFKNADAALARRNDVLERMADQGMIAPKTAAEAKQRPLGVEAGRYYTQRRESFFFDYVKQELIDRYGTRRVRQGGLSVKTTINLKLQQAARKAINGRLAGVGPSSAIVSIDPRNGYIRAMASSANYRDSKFNLAAQGKRQPGSAFKTMGLLAAFDKGVSEGTSYASKPLKFNDPKYGPIDVNCYGDACAGRSLDLTTATLKSDNSVYTQLALDIGPDAIVKAARGMGIKSKLEGVPAEVLGGLSRCCSPLEMSNAYATLASGGWRNRPKAISKVTFPDGKVENLAKPRRHKAFRDGATLKVTKILERNIQGGTGTKARIQCPAAGKTGTTDSNKDAWFVGYTPRLSTAVWVGYPKSQVEMRGLYNGANVDGGTFPAEIWGDYMRVAVRGKCASFPGSPKEPVTSAPFFGTYSRTGVPSTNAPDAATSYAPQPSTPGGGGTNGGGGSTGGGGGNSTGGGGGGGGGFNPDLYESPPQGPPSTGGAGGTGGGGSSGGAAAGE